MLDLEEAVARCRRQLVPVAEAVNNAETFSLQLPCAALIEGKTLTTSLTGLRGYLPCSNALASAPIERFLALKEKHGFDQAFALCSSDDVDGKAFVEAWDESQRDLADGVVMTLNDLVAMVSQAKEGWSAEPRRMLVVARRGDKVASGTVSTEWVLERQ